MSETRYMLTTVDNPYNPFTHFKEWYSFDIAHQRDTPAFLARITKSSDELPLALQLRAIEQAIDEIVEENVSGLYRKVSESSFDEV